MLASYTDILTQSQDALVETDLVSNQMGLVVAIVLAAMIFHHFVCSPLRELKEAAAGNQKCLDKIDWHTVVCPRRRQRFLKCARRYRRRQQDESGCCSALIDECDGQSSAAKECTVSLPMPPPLPFVRHRKRRKGQCSAWYPNKKSGSASQAATLPQDAATNLTPTSLAPVLADQNLPPQASSSDASSQSSHFSDASTLTSGMKSLTTQPPIHRTTLMDLVRMQQWDTILNHPRRDELFRRRNAKYCDVDGLYPLHWACSGAPSTAVVQSLLEAYPSAARKEVGKEAFRWER